MDHRDTARRLGRAAGTTDGQDTDRQTGDRQTGDGTVGHDGQTGTGQRRPGGELAGGDLGTRGELAGGDLGTVAELAGEQAYVTMLYLRLDELRARTRTALEHAQRPDAGGGSAHQALVDRDALVGLHTRRLVELSAVEHGLCVGRLDLHDATRRYVGRIGLADDDHEPLLIDWRAPAARPFYQATPAQPGDVVRRRHLQTDGRRVIGFSDDVMDLATLTDTDRAQLNGEAALLAALNAGRTGRMADIVATIQSEQDRVIREDLPGILVVAGGPGTGKTAVALHRAAYLLYTHRERLARRGVLVVGPNPVFLRYIQQVLPSLGETDVLLSTVAELYPGVTADADEDPAAATLKGEERMAEVLAAAVADRQELPTEATLAVSVGDDVLHLDRETCAHAREVARAAGLPHNHARHLFADQLVAALATQVAERLQADLHEAELLDETMFADEEVYEGPLLDEGQLTDLRAELAADPGVGAALQRLWPELTPERLLADLFASAERIAAAAPGLDAAERALLHRDAYLDETGPDKTGPEAAAVPGGWTPADVPLLDEAAELLGADETAAGRTEERLAAEEERELAYARGVLQVVDVDGEVVDPGLIAERYRERGPAAPVAERARGDRRWVFGHVIVDEAQELPPMAWRMLVRRCPSRSMTVVGDLAQTGAPGGATSWAAVLDPLAAGHWRQAELTVNYRTPTEIMAVAADVLASVNPALRPPTSVRQTGVAPWQLQVAPEDLPARLPEIVAAEAATLGDGRLAVLLPAAWARALGERVAAAVPGTAADGPDALDARVAVLTVTAAKGLEFDRVVVVDPDGILAESPSGARNLYVALTRATQQLGVVHLGALPPVLSRLTTTPDGLPGGLPDDAADDVAKGRG